MWFVVGYSGELLAYFLQFSSHTHQLFFKFMDPVCDGSLGGEHSLLYAFKL
jgi:hypothetical protein